LVDHIHAVVDACDSRFSSRFDKLEPLLADHVQVVVLEEMVPHGGLADAVKVIAHESGLTCKIDCFSLKDEFIHCYGKHEDVLAAHGLALPVIFNRIRAG
jgi:transketolase